jgi:hypothetical protein
MPAQLNTEFTLPRDPTKVFEMLTRLDFLAAKIGLAQSGEFSVTGSGFDLTVNVNRTVAADLPDLVRKFVGQNLVVQETQIWRKSNDNLYRADFKLTIPNAPVDISGQIELAGIEKTIVKISGKVKVNVPIFGAAAEPQVVSQISKVLADEEELCRNWISK